MAHGPVQPRDDPLAGQACHQSREQPLNSSLTSASTGQTPAGGAREPQGQRPASATSEPTNPFYALLLIFSVAFVLTGLVLALVPWPELPSWLQHYGWKLLLGEMALVILTGLASMALDRWRK